MCNGKRLSQNVFINAGLKLDIMVAFHLSVSDDLNGPSGIEYVVKQDKINQIISKVSDTFINAGLKLDNSGSIRSFV